MRLPFYDTCALLEGLHEKNPDEKFYITYITLKELEKIKTSANKDEGVKYKARKVLNYLANNEDKYEVIYSQDVSLLTPNTPDGNIINSIVAYKNAISCYQGKFIVFITLDVGCYLMAKAFNLKAELPRAQTDTYAGYKEVSPTDEEYGELYTNPNNNIFNCLPNEYLIVPNDILKWDGTKYEKVMWYSCDSKMFGKVAPMSNDPYQVCLLDSFHNNKITMVGGPAGSGKTFLALSFLFSKLEQQQIDRIVIFCNPVVARNAAKLGFYPGTVLEKLLSTQVGSVLTSKIGDSVEVERLINEGKLVLMPAGDARGYEVPAHSGVYIMESQNLDIVLLRMILQRIGEECVTIVDGDREEQTDMEIYSGSNNGMARMSEVFRGKHIFGQVDLKNIYRSEIAKIADEM